MLQSKDLTERACWNELNSPFKMFRHGYSLNEDVTSETPHNARFVLDAKAKKKLHKCWFYEVSLTVFSVSAAITPLSVCTLPSIWPWEKAEWRSAVLQFRRTCVGQILLIFYKISLFSDMTDIWLHAEITFTQQVETKPSGTSERTWINMCSSEGRLVSAEGKLCD